MSDILKPIADAIDNAIPFGKGGGSGDGFNLELSRYEKNDFGNAQRLLRRHGDDLLHVDAIGWHVWDGRRYNVQQGSSHVMRKAHETVTAMAAEEEAMRKVLGDGKDEQERAERFARFRQSSGNLQRVNGMISSAAPYLTVSAQTVDADPWLLNCYNGTVNLKERGLGCARGDDDETDPRLGAHHRDHKITKLAPVTFNAKTECPNWMAFLNKVQPSADVRLFLQCWFGYCLSGDNSEQKLLILHGLGSNGKSTMVNTLLDVMGDYSATVDISTFMSDEKRRGGDATPDLARLPGARLVVASEPEPGAKLNESSVKTITGGERMVARQLFKEQFEFEPNFKVVISCNHRPKIKGQDHGIWRRILIVPFEVTLNPHELDPHLKDKLQAEASGILNWLMDGLAIYRERGLCTPPEVVAAVEDYRNESDPVGQFLKACTVPDKKSNVKASELYEAYGKWCRQNALDPISSNAFGRSMSDRGFRREKYGVMFYVGLELDGDELDL